jgi:hypothetical protein
MGSWAGYLTRRPLLTITATALALLAVIAAACHYRGVCRYEQLMARWRQEGRMTTLDDLRSSAPATDDAAQHALETALKHASVPDPGLSELFDRPEVHDYILGRRSDLPSALAPRFDPYDVDLAAIRIAIKASGPMDAFSGRSEPEMDWDHPQYIQGQWVTPLQYLNTMRSAHYIRIASVRPPASWLRYRALTSRDPAGELADLDRLVSITSHPLSLDAHFIGADVARTRDLAYLEAACRGLLTGDQQQRWLDNDPDLLSRLADSHRGWRISGVSSLADHLRSKPGDMSWRYPPRLSLPLLGGLEDVIGGGQLWLFGMDDCVVLEEAYAAVEDRLRGRRDDVEYRLVTPSRFRSPVAAAFGNLVESIQSTLQAQTFQREVRLAVRCLEMARQRGHLPLDEQDFIAQLPVHDALADGKDRLLLRYEKLATDRFRITVDPQSPVPNYAAGDRLPMYSLLGKPSRPVKRDDGTLAIPLIAFPYHGILPLNIEVTLPARHANP